METSAGAGAPEPYGGIMACWQEGIVDSESLAGGAETGDRPEACGESPTAAKLLVKGQIVRSHNMMKF